jgi:TRAP-type C4-dicarboxylate transport system substrate-binding protein
MPQMYESVIKGVADVGNVMTGLTTSRFPLMQALWTTPIDYPNSLVATRIVNAVYAKFTPKEFDDVKVLYWHVSPQASLHTVKKPVLKVEDMKGMKIRCGDSPAKIVAEFGAAPVMLPMAEVYDGLSKGVIDGVVSVYEALKTFKTGDMLKYTTEIKSMAFTGVYAVAMNKNKWNSIPPDLQKIIEEINKEWAEKQGKLWDVKEQEGKEYGISKGLKIVKFSAEEQAKWDTKARPLTDEYITNTKKANLPGEELIKFVRDYLKTAPIK